MLLAMTKRNVIASPQGVAISLFAMTVNFFPNPKFFTLSVSSCSNQGSNALPVFPSPIVLKDAEGLAIAVDSYYTPCVVDWNGDGKKDLLVGDGEGYIHLYLNISKNSEPQLISSGRVKVSDQDLKVGGSAVPFLVDWDNDGRKDLLVGSIEGYIYLFTH
jgi:hypothetical protein